MSNDPADASPPAPRPEPVPAPAIQGRLLGIDPGTVRIGLALSDSERRLASPLQTYTRRTALLDSAFFKKLIADEDIVAVVVGLPVNMDGSEGGQAKAARTFGAWLAAATEIPVRFWDERLTSFEADQHLNMTGLTKKGRKARRDMIAAHFLLQSYLDAGCPTDRES